MIVALSDSLTYSPNHDVEYHKNIQPDYKQIFVEVEISYARGIEPIIVDG